MQLKTCLIFVNENVKTNSSERAEQLELRAEQRSVALRSFYKNIRDIDLTCLIFFCLNANDLFLYSISKMNPVRT